MGRILQGSIFHQHPGGKRCSVQLENGDYCVIEPAGDLLPNFGDIISGDLDTLGLVTLENRTASCQFEVLVHHIRCSRVEALQYTTMI